MQYQQNRMRLGLANVAGLYTGGRGITANISRAVVLIKAAWDFGYRRFDSAPLYGWGYSESLFGEAFKQLVEDALIVGADELDISTKALRTIIPRLGQGQTKQPNFWGPLPEPFASSQEFWTFSETGVLSAFSSSLERLGLAKVSHLKLHDTGDAMAEVPGMKIEEFDPAINACKRLLNDSNPRITNIGLANKDNATGLALLARHPGTFTVVGTTTYNLLDQSAHTSGLIDACHKAGAMYQVNGPYSSRVLAMDVRKARRVNSAVHGRLGYFWDASGTDPVSINYGAVETDTNGHWQNLDAFNKAVLLWNTAADLGYDSPRPLALQFCLANPKVGEVVVGAGDPKRFQEMRDAIALSIPRTHWRRLVDEGIIDSSCPLPS